MNKSHEKLPLLLWINRGLYLLLILFVSLLVIFNRYQMKNYEDVSRSEIIKVSEQIQSEIKAFFAPVNLVDHLVEEVWVTQHDFYEEALKHEPMIRKIVGLYPEIDSVYFGDERGNFALYIESDEGEVDTKIVYYGDAGDIVVWRYYKDDTLIEETITEGADFDPRTRPWYFTGDQKGLNFIDPYEFFTKGDRGLTVSRQIYQGETLWGNYGVDVRLTHIESFLSEINQNPKFYGLLTTQNGIEIKGDLQEKSFVSNLDVSVAMTMEKTENQVDEVADGILFMKKELTLNMNNPLSAVVFADYSEYKNSIQLSRLLVYLCIGLLLLIYMNSYLGNRMHRDARSHLIKIANFDKLTGLMNRHSFEEVFNRYKLAYEEKGIPFAVVIGDIDHFKHINDEFGHNNGDVVLKTIAGVLTRSARNTDTVFRWGGEEFLMLLSNADAQSAYEISERIRHAVLDAVTVSGPYSIKCTMSFGVSLYHKGGEAKELVKEADDELYRAKQSGRNKVCFKCEGERL